MSKCVIIAPSLNNIVIKIPFSGTYNYCYEDFKDKKIKSIDYIDERGNPYNFTHFKIFNSNINNNSQIISGIIQSLYSFIHQKGSTFI